MVYVHGLADRQTKYDKGNGAFRDSASALENYEYFNRARLGRFGKKSAEILYP